MSEAGGEGATSGAESKSFFDLLKSFVGKTVTVVNPESYEAAPVGYQLKAGFYRAKVTGMGQDFLTLITELKKTGKSAGAEPVKQFMPVARIKRLSVMKGECVIHI